MKGSINFKFLKTSTSSTFSSFPNDFKCFKLLFVKIVQTYPDNSTWKVDITQSHMHHKLQHDFHFRQF